MVASWFCGSILACQADDPGTIPGMVIFLIIEKKSDYEKLQKFKTLPKCISCVTRILEEHLTCIRGLKGDGNISLQGKEAYVVG